MSCISRVTIFFGRVKYLLGTLSIDICQSKKNSSRSCILRTSIDNPASFVSKKYCQAFHKATWAKQFRRQILHYNVWSVSWGIIHQKENKQSEEQFSKGHSINKDIELRLIVCLLTALLYRRITGGGAESFARAISSLNRIECFLLHLVWHLETALYQLNDPSHH
jgi:hypothetical protein